MTEKTLNTKIILRHDDLAKWESSSKVLAIGEIGLAKVDTQKPDGNGGFYTVPTYLMKVGDGSSTFADLNWLAAPASDVHQWAKAATKPTYNGTEIKLSTATDAKTISAAIDALERAVGAESVDSQIDTKITSALDTLALDDEAVNYQFVTAVAQEDGQITVTRRALAAADIPNLEIAKITGLQAAIDLKADASDLTTLTTTVQGADGNGGIKKDLADEISNRENADKALGKRIDDLNTAIGDVANIMNFKGVVTTDPSKVTSGYNNGDVVIYGGKEFVFSTSDNKFHEFGDASGNANAISDLDTRVDTAESKIAALEELKISSTYATKNELSNGLAGKVDNTSFNNYKTTTIEPVVATVGDEDSGLVKDVADLQTAVGKAKQGQTAGTGLTGRVEALETASATHATADALTAQKERIDAVYTKFGDNTNLADVLIFDCGTATSEW